MKIKLLLTTNSVSFEYMDTTPFIQGTDTRNKLYIYRDYSATPALTNISVAYFIANGRTTLPLPNTSATTETIDGVVYNKWTFNVPAAATALAGNVVMTVAAKISTGVYKLNVLNNVLNSSEFDAFQSALTGAEAAYAQAMDDLESSQTVQDQRISTLENNEDSAGVQIGLINREVFGNSTGESTDEGLKYIVRTNYKNRIASLESIDAGTRLTAVEGELDTLDNLHIGTRLTALESYEIGYFTLSTASSSGTLTTNQLAEVNKNDCIIERGGYYFTKEQEYKVTGSGENGYDTIVNFQCVEMFNSPDLNLQINKYTIAVNLTTRAYTYTLYTKRALCNLANNFDSDLTGKALSATKGKSIYDDLETLKTYVYQGSDNGVLDRLKEVFDFLDGESEDTTLLNLLNEKADKTTTYTKTEVNSLLTQKANADSVYTTIQTNNLLELKADKASTYTKTEVNSLLGAKANSSDVYTKSQTYQKSEVYNKSEVYSKSEVDDIVNDLTVDGYEMPYDRMVAIFNDAYSTDPVVTALNNLNGEAV